MRKRIAVVGSGVAGLVCARLLALRHDVALFEAADRLGGHAHTVECQAHGRRVAADVGFMVFNRRTYPNFCRLLELLGIEGQPSEMSFSVRADHAGLEYQSTRLFAQRRNVVSPGFWRMLADVVRFNRHARRLVAARGQAADDQPPGPDELGAGETVGEFLRQGRYGRRFWDDYLLPMTAAIWSAPPRQVEEFPAAFLFAFLRNHGLLDLRDRPQWLTIPGGSRRYVAALAAPLGEAIRLATPVERVRRRAGARAVRRGGARDARSAVAGDAGRRDGGGAGRVGGVFLSTE
jgi:predicted NAD/FAD-binding protein